VRFALEVCGKVKKANNFTGENFCARTKRLKTTISLIYTSTLLITYVVEISVQPSQRIRKNLRNILHFRYSTVLASFAIFNAKLIQTATSKLTKNILYKCVLEFGFESILVSGLFIF
jgi:hypothetical protein